MKTFQYFQPEYVSRFKCDGSKCSARCCNRPWDTPIDNVIYKKYRQIKPKNKAEEIISHIEFNYDKGNYMLKGRPCPFLTEDKRCSLQLEYGESFLPATCATYPRHTVKIRNLFERSLSLTCPVAAEMILFNPEPMKFELVEVPDKIHSKHGRILIDVFHVHEQNTELFHEIQFTMITILQERRFSLDQRLILLGLFLDKLQECRAYHKDEETILQLILGYRLKEFLAGEATKLVQLFNFDEQKFITFIMKFINHTLDCLLTDKGLKFLIVFVKTFGLITDANNQVSIPGIIANYNRLANARRDFLEKHSLFLENYLVNELFYSFYPWRFLDESITKNFAVFLISYKIFELVTFATVHSGLDSKEELLTMVDWFIERTDHNPNLYERFLELLMDVNDMYLLMATLL